MNPFDASRSEQEVFGDLDILCGSPGYIHVLAHLSLRDNLISYDGHMTSEDMAASYAPGRTIRTEFSTLMGLMLKHPIDFKVPAPAEMQILIDKTEALLNELHACLNQPMLEGLRQAVAAQQAGVPVDEAGSFFRRGDVLREPIFYGGESAYSFQYRDFALERYAKDDDWLHANKGFRVAEAHAVAGALVRLQNRKVMEAIKGMRRLHPSQWTTLPGFTSSLDEIASEANIVPETASAVLSAFTAPEPPTNASFASLGDFNIANALPIQRSPSGDYVSLQTYGVVEALYDSPFYWMAADKSYKDTAFAHRGAFTESFVARRLSAVFGSDKVYRSVTIISKGSRVSEIDVLVLFADRAIVIQCKSKKLTLEARKGNDLQLRDDFKKSVHDAYDQAHLCSKSLGNPDLEFVGDDGSKINVPPLREIYPICVISDHYPALTVQAREFLKYETDETIQPPLVADVFLIDVLAEMLPSPLRLLSYVNRRVNYSDRINSVNELTILAYHLRQNLWIDDKTDMVMLGDELAIDLDTAMTVRREGIEGATTPSGILTRLNGTLVGRMLESIEHSAEAALVDLGLMLLTLSSETLEDINRGLKEIAARTREDGRHHDFTLAFDKGDTGLTVQCGPLPNAEAAERLAEYCQRRKYVQRAESWFGLVVRADDGLPKFGLNLRFPWKHDEAMDEATKGMARGERPRRGRDMFKRRKVGRNDSCPCGSGKKYKKCCMN
jgi:SEC-C motif/Nuclease-related domain